MKTIKPQRLGVLTRAFEFRGDAHLAVAALGFFGFEAPDTLRTEVAMWKFAAQALGRDGALDAAMPKARGEVLVCGSAHCVGGARAAADVTVTVDALEKRLRVVGDRVWRGGAMTAPAPFAEMPVTWERAYGGPGFLPNPLGVGAAAAREGGALPNIEDPRRMITHPTDRPAPAGLLPLDPMVPQRASRAGTYDDRWLRERFPGLADDIDWSYFNVAPEDQWLPGFFRGDEAFSVAGMHPEEPVVSGRLPDLVARAFVTKREPSGERFEELAMRAETLWLFPAARCGILIWRGTVRVREDDASDVVHLVLAADRRDAPRPASHYEAVLAERLDPDRGALATLRDDPLVPVGDVGAAAPSAEVAEMDALLRDEGLVRKNLRNASKRERDALQARLVADGVDPAHIPAFEVEDHAPTLAEMPALMEALQRKGEALKVQSDAQRQEAQQAMREVCAAEGVDFDAVMRGPPGGPPRFSADEQLAGIAALAADSRANGAPSPELEALLEDPAFVARLRNAEARLREIYARYAQHMPPAEPLAPEAAAWVRRQVEEARAMGASLAQNDLTGADLSGMDLSGADLRGALLEAADLRGTSLRGAALDGAVLVRAQLAGADLTDARLAGANLSRATLPRAVLAGADLTGASLVAADLREANLQGATLVEADLQESAMLGADLSRARAAEVLFLRNDLTGVAFADADLTKATFLEAVMDRADLSRATLTSAVLLTVRAEGLVARGASASNLRAVKDCVLDGADFQGADLHGANVRGTRLARAELSGANLDGADLSGCDLRGARLYRAVAREARFERADLREADLRGANLMRALLPHADLRSADLSGSNLFRADLARVRTDTATRLTDALLEQARVVARREAP
jgi:uncharacterized protein YjbI with pentapeptide repeats